jgi:hypothetical protein
LFHQCRRIAGALDEGELALAQIYGLHIPIGDLDDQQLKRLAILSIFTKAGFDPDEPRVPKGDPRGGQWTNDGGGGAASSDNAALSFDEAPSTADAPVMAGGPVSDERQAMEYQIVPTETNTSPGGNVSPSASRSPSSTGFDGAGQLPPVVAYAVTPSALSLLGDILPETLKALTQTAARMSGPTLVFGILFIPSNRSMVVQGTVTNSPDLSYHYDRDIGVLQIRQEIGSLGSAVLTEGHIDVDGRFRDANGRAIGRVLPGGGIIIDIGTLPGYRMLLQAGTAPDASIRVLDQPKLCPDPTPENIRGRSDRAIAYQSQITGLPPGLQIVFNGERYDGCRESDGHLLEAKGGAYGRFMADPNTWHEWFGKLRDMERQMYDHSRFSAGRIVEYHFAEKRPADYFRAHAAERYPNVIVYYSPPRDAR